MAPDVESWRAIVADSLAWEQAHVDLDHAVEGLPSALQGQRADGFPHSAWELLEHIRLTQRDLVDFMEDPAYQAPDWPAGYWPSTATPPTESAWRECIAAIHADRERLQHIALRPGLDLTVRIPQGTGQTYLRTLLVAVDHTSYHVGQIVALRRLLGAWP